MKFLILFSWSLLVVFSVHSQKLFFKFENQVPVEENGRDLKNPWAGGLNGAQISKIDLDNNSAEDLLVFDRVTGKISTFISKHENNDPHFTYAAPYEFLFPPLKGWVLAADFNCDGKKDIFTAGDLGNVAVYKNISTEGEAIKLILWEEALTTEGLSGKTSIHVSQADVPSIVDLDDDGDLDIITFDPSGGHTAILHKNESIEQFGNCDSLVFKRIGTCWGRFMKEHNCAGIEFGVDCGTTEVMRTLHTGSSALVLDFQGDGVKDLLMGGVECSNLVRLNNTGESLNATFTSSTDTFPQKQVPVFPAPFYEDVDFDGVKDLLVSSNISSNLDRSVNLAQSIVFFKNTGSNNAPSLTLDRNNFLQSEMIDLGEYAYPALVDIDGDEDLDLVVGRRGERHSDNSYFSTLYYYKNIGTKEDASFKLISTDYLGFSTQMYQNVKPLFLDVNADSRLDLVFAYTDVATAYTSLSYILNTASTGVQLHLNDKTPIDFSFESFDHPLLIDVDKDGVLDLLLGRTRGRVEYFKNIGSNLVPSYQLENDRFAGIKNSIMTLNPAPFAFDLDGTGDKELLVGDRSGILKFFFDWRTNYEDSLARYTDFLYNEFAEEYTEGFFGKEVFPTAGDLNNDGMAELILGTNGGGLILLKNETAINPKEPGLELKKFTVYPNPSSNTFFIESEISGSVQVYSSLGKLIFKKDVQRGARAEIKLNAAPKGIYIFKLITPAGTSISRKLLKE